MTIRAILLNPTTGNRVPGVLTTDSAASSDGLAVFRPDRPEGAFTDAFGNIPGTVYHRGDLGPNWRLCVSHEDGATAFLQPAWKSIVAEIHPPP